MNPFAGMPTTGIGNPFASGYPMSRLLFNPPTAAQGYNPNAASPIAGSWSVAPEPRQQLAQIMSGQHRSDRGSMRGGSGYTTSGPQRGGFGYGGGQGGWGRAPGGRSSATKGGMWGGGLY